MMSIFQPLSYLKGSKALTFASALWFVALLYCAYQAQIDDRLFQGVSVWVKPMKFFGSMVVYFLTFAFFIGLLTEQGRRSWVTRLIVVALLTAGTFEVVYIAMQAAAGAKSHFNFSSATAITLYILMGVGATVLTLCALGLGIYWTRQSTLSHGPVRTAIFWGLMITGVAGIITGFSISGNQGHWVGGAQTDAGGLPIVGWVRDGGDLRVPHFFALHAMQIIPAYGAFLMALGVRGRIGNILVVAFSLGLIALIVATLAQAQQGLPYMPSWGV